MTAYNPAEIERLVREAREPGLRPTDAAVNRLRLALERECSDTPVAHLAQDAQATLWQLQQIANRAEANLHAMADQLEGARARIAEQDRDLADARRDVMLQAARLAALESELATLKASVINALSSAGPEVPEDERTT